MRKIILLRDTKGLLTPTNHENLALFYKIKGEDKKARKTPQTTSKSLNSHSDSLMEKHSAGNLCSASRGSLLCTKNAF